jgi:hypothetical protein
MPEGRQRYYNNDGTPCAGGHLWTYAAGTSNLKATYADEAGTILNQNPVPLDAKGEALIFWSGAYKVDLKQADGTQVTGYPVDNLKTDPAGIWGVLGTVLAQLAQSAGSSLMGFIQAGAGAIARTLQAKNRETISVTDFGAKGDGVTDDTAAIQAAANAAAGKALYFPATPASYKITAEINIAGYTTVYGDGRGSVVKLSGLNKDGFFVNQQAGVTIRDLRITCDVVGTLAYVGGVHLYKSLRCKVINVEFDGLHWAGVLLNSSSHCRVRDCAFSGWVGTAQDSADVLIFRNSGFNKVDGNLCAGGGDHGIAIYDPYENTTPTGNIITGNVVTEHKAYGIMVYIGLATTPPYDLRTVIANNVVSDILGTGPGVSGISGAGIYIQGGGGVSVIGNTVSNCCRTTPNFDTLGMAGISVQVGEGGTSLEVEAIVQGNHVHQYRGPCMFLAASIRPLSVIGNTLKSESTANLRGEAVVIQNCNAVRFVDNDIRHENPNFYAVKMAAIGKECSYNNLSGNTLQCVNSGGGFLLTATEGGSLSNTVMAHNTVGGSLANPAYMVQFVANLRFFGNHGDSAGLVFSLYNCARAHLSGNRLHSSAAAYAIQFLGANPNSFADESNDFDGWVQNDEGNGMRITLRGAGAPATTGSWSSGDRVINIAPAPGAVSAWVNCAGVWKSTGTVAP